MGLNLALNAHDHGHDVFAFDAAGVEEERITVKESVEAVVASMDAPRTVWMMVPAGDATEDVFKTLLPLLQADDIIIDGGNARFTDSKRRDAEARERGVHFFDCGTSGGTSGAREGACLMIGGEKDAFGRIEGLISDLALENGYLYTGPAGSGHYLKMIHNGIEYGMMQALAEGFEMLDKSEFDYDYEQVARVWNHGSVVRSWLVELLEQAFKEDANLDAIKGVMHSSGEGKWTVETALDMQVAAPVIALSLMMRYRSLEEDTFSGKVVAALRNQFGGHAVVKK